MRRQTKQYNGTNIKTKSILVKKLCEMSHVVKGREQGLAGEGEFEEVSFEGLFK